ncbi:MAG: CotH kinase family protein [Bacteroidota bacterium]
MSRCTFCILWMLGISLQISAQSLHINELVSNNSVLQDADGDTPDWIELYNSGTDTLQLEGYRINDRPDAGSAWEFPEASFIAPQGHLMVFASGKDIKEINGFEPVIRLGDEWRYFTPNNSSNGTWKVVGFNDNSWLSGPTSIGYGDDDDSTLVAAGTRTLFLRKQIQLTDLSSIKQLILHVDYDDSFVAYMNGVEIGRANIGAPGAIPSYLQPADTDREAQIYQGGYPEKFVYEDPMNILQDGPNVLAIEVHNVGASSSDLSIFPFLTLARSAYQTSEPIPALLQLSSLFLHTDFKLSSEGESIYLFRPDGQLIDSVQFPRMPANLSMGRFPDGQSQFVFFSNQTPNAPNAADHFDGILQDSIRFSHTSGAFGSNIPLTMTHEDAAASIYYTLNGEEPTEADFLYNDSLLLEQTSILRARAFRPGYVASPTMTHTYIIKNPSSLPTISIVTDPYHLWDNDSGMYVLGDEHESDFPFFGANFWQDWEKPVNLSVLDESGKLVYQSDAGMKIFGGWSRALDQKSLSLFARKRYGDEPFAYPFFPNRPYDEYEALVLRNSGNDWGRSLMRDGMMTSLMKGSAVDIQAYRPTRVFLNGQYWGIHNLREKINEHYFASLHGVDPATVDLLEFNGDLIHGDNADYQNMIQFIRSANLSSDNNYQVVANQIDLDNYIQYQVAQIYFDNTDWPGNNIKYWRADGGKWRWVLFDTDFGFGIWDPHTYQHNTLRFALEANGPGWPNPPWSTLLFRKLIENQTFRHAFINQYADELNSRFIPQHVSNHINKVSNHIRPEIDAHMDRWNRNANEWNNILNQMRNWANQRPSHARFHIQNVFELPNQHLIRVENPETEKGMIQLNSLLLEYANWNGIYYESVPITLTAIAKPGYIFDHWSGDVNSTEKEIILDLQFETTVVAHFIASEGGQTESSAIVINEINYKSSEAFDPKDWVELTNVSQETVDLTDWELKDGNDEHVYRIPAQTMLAPQEFLILCRDKQQFDSLLPDVSNSIGNIDFGISSKGESIRLFDNFGILRDVVSFESTSPWPESPNGTGATLALISPLLDNSLYKSWRGDPQPGTPGASNTPDSIIVIPPPPDPPFLDSMMLVYPNPFDKLLTVQIGGLDVEEIQFELYTVLGQKVFERKEVYVIPNTTAFRLNFPELGNGMYMLRVQTDKGTYDFPILKQGE